MKSAVGLGLRHPFHGYVLEQKPAVPFFEVITENYLCFDGAPRSFLQKVRSEYPLVFHGVSLSIGSLEPVRMAYLTQLKKMIQEFQPLWISDHLCWTYNGPENSHDLLPVPFTKESLKRIIAKTQQVQEFLGQKIYLENPSAYVDFKENDFSEEDFVSELCDRSGCGLLLDLNNLVVNQFNLGYNPINYLSTIRKCDVKQIHLAGHTIKEKVRIDTHDQEISQEVLDLIPIAKAFWPEANPMIEWDDKIPAIGELLTLRQEIETLWKNATPGGVVRSAAVASVDSRTTSEDSVKHQAFWKLLKTEEYIEESDSLAANILKADLPTPAHVGMNVYSSAYYSRQLEVLEKIFPALKVVLDEVFSDVMLEYLVKCPSAHDSIDFIGNDLAQFIKEHNFAYDLGVDQRIVSDIANFESLKNLSVVALSDKHPALNTRAFSEADWLNKKLKLKSEVMIQEFHSEIHPAIEAIQSGKTPEVPDLKKTHYAFYRHGHDLTYKQIANDEFELLKSFSSFRTFSEDTFAQSLEQIQFAAAMLFKNEDLFCTE